MASLLLLIIRSYLYLSLEISLHTLAKVSLEIPSSQESVTYSHCTGGLAVWGRLKNSRFLNGLGRAGPERGV